MIKPVLYKGIEFISITKKFQEQNPYLFSFAITMVVSLMVLFYTPSVVITQSDFLTDDKLKLVDLDIKVMQKRRAKRELSLDESNSVVSEEEVERAEGESYDESAEDLSYLPNVARPKLISRFRKTYPAHLRKAEKMDVSAVVKTELLISPQGKVVAVEVLGVRLLKVLPPELDKEFSLQFAKAGKFLLLGKQFTPPIVDGKSVPVKMEYEFKYEMEK